MELSLWILTIVMTFALSYSLQFTGATLAMGRELAETTTGTGFQDAITPPWETKLSLAIYAGCVMVLGVMWWQLGWLSALGGFAVLFLGASVAKFFLPSPTSGHYRTLIIQSMCSRYADFVRDGDALRADAMKQLLIKIGIDPDAMTGV